MDITAEDITNMSLGLNIGLSYLNGGKLRVPRGVVLVGTSACVTAYCASHNIPFGAAFWAVCTVYDIYRLMKL